MEELFRRASEDYPLKQGDDKWSEIASKINGMPISPGANKQQNRYRKYSVVLLFLFLFLNLEFFFSTKFSNQNATLQKFYENEIKQVNHNTKNNKDIEDNILEKINCVSRSTISKNVFNGASPSPLNRNIEQLFVSRIAGTQGDKIKNVQSFNQPINFTNDFEIKVLDRSAQSVINIKDINSNHSNNNSLSIINSSDTGSMAEQFTPSPSISAEKKITNQISMDRFYYGLLLGTTLNTVKNQDRNKFGFDIGFIGGYRFNRHISVETGVLFSQKYYTTAGEYFSLKEIGPMMPAAMKVMDVKGTSKVVEIPVYLRYNVLNKKEHRFFSSAGFSSYILTKESNQYFTSLNGTEGIMYGTYKTNRSYFAASFDLAIGYEKNFGKKSSIRFQPYVQLPVKGIGVGNLKVMSTGVHIAITRSSQ